MRKTKGFSLLELLIAMAVLTITATVAVPKVQVWNARNRGLQTVMELISDFSKARSVAGYTVAVNSDSGKIEIPVDSSNPDGDTMPVYMGVRRQTAMVFRKSEYGIYQKQSMKSDDWSSATSIMLKRNKLLDTVTLEDINGLQPSSNVSSFGTHIVFTSSGRLKDSSGIVQDGHSSSQCGDDAAYLDKVVFTAIIRSKVSMSGDDSIWYRISIDTRGEYAVCTVCQQESDSISSTDFENNGIMLDI